MGSVIRGVGNYRPDGVVTNKDLGDYLLEDFGPLTRRVIERKSKLGIKSRRWEMWHPRERGNNGNMLEDYPKDGKTPFSKSWRYIHDVLGMGEINTGSLYDSGMAYMAALDAIRKADIHPSEIDAVLYTTSTPDALIQQQSGKIAHALGIRNDAFVQDIVVGCSGFWDGVWMADKFIKSGDIKNVLVTGSNMASNYAKWHFNSKNRDYKVPSGHPAWFNMVLFGDAAGAVILGEGNGDERGLICGYNGYEPRDNPAFLLAGGSAVGMTPETVERDMEMFYVHNGHVRKHAPRLMERAVDGVLTEVSKTNGRYDLDSFDVFVPHQASNGVLLDTARLIGIQNDKMINDLENNGNIVCANLPLVMSDNLDRFEEDKLVMPLVVGGGWKYGAGIYRCGDEFEKMKRLEEELGKEVDFDTLQEQANVQPRV